jgi:protein TonB
MLQLTPMLRIMLAGIPLVSGACSGASMVVELKSDEKPVGLPGKASPSPTSTPERSTLPPNARLFSVKEGVLLGMAIQKVQPEYPLEAQAKGITGEVKIRVSINQEGHVGEAVAHSGHPLLQAAALTAVKQWRWRPTMIDTDGPVYVQGTLTFHFPPRS